MTCFGQLTVRTPERNPTRIFFQKKSGRSLSGNDGQLTKTNPFSIILNISYAFTVKNIHVIHAMAGF